MWWTQFEIKLNFAYNVCNKKEGRQVYSNEMHQRTLIKKVKVDFITVVKSAIKVALSVVSLTITFKHTLKAFSDVVTTKYPPEITAPYTVRSIQQNDQLGKMFEQGGRCGGR